MYFFGKSYTDYHLKLMTYMYMNKCNPLLNGRAVWSKGADHAWTSAEHWSCDECIEHWTSNEFPQTFNEQMLSKWEKKLEMNKCWMQSAWWTRESKQCMNALYQCFEYSTKYMVNTQINSELMRELLKMKALQILGWNTFWKFTVCW